MAPQKSQADNESGESDADTPEEWQEAEKRIRANISRIKRRLQSEQRVQSQAPSLSTADTNSHEEPESQRPNLRQNHKPSALDAITLQAWFKDELGKELSLDAVERFISLPGVESKRSPHDLAALLKSDNKSHPHKPSQPRRRKQKSESAPTMQAESQPYEQAPMPTDEPLPAADGNEEEQRPAWAIEMGIPQPPPAQHSVVNGIKVTTTFNYPKTREEAELRRRELRRLGYKEIYWGDIRIY